MDAFLEFLGEHFADCVWLAVILLAICPILESKIAIPIAMNSVIWGSRALSPVAACALSFAASLIPVIFIILITRKIKSKTELMLTSKFLEKYSSKTQKIEGKNSNFKKYLTLAGFVAVPLPLTGVWTGSIIAGITNLNIGYCFLSIMIGSLISCIAMTVICSVFINSLTNILIISLIIIILFLLVDLIVSCFKRKSNKKRGD